MPLFKKNHGHSAADAAEADVARHEDISGRHNAGGVGAGTTTHGTHPTAQQHNLGPQELTGASNMTTTAPQAGYQTGPQNPGLTGQQVPLQHGQELGAGQMGTGPAIAPTNHYAPSGHNHPSGASRAAGKVEHAVGSLVGSSALKNRGLEKEQEAQAFKAQAAELGEAERLEREAVLRRERAVAHGAHPDNRHLGGAGHNSTMQ